MLFVSREEPQQRFASPVISDDGSVSKLFGSPGTPSAILLGSDGRVASNLAVGGPDVRALIGIPEGYAGPPTVRVADPTMPPDHRTNGASHEHVHDHPDAPRSADDV
jgi:hypothetical protein